MTRTIAFIISRIFGPESTISLGIWALLSFATDLVWRENIWFVLVMLLLNILLPIGVYIVFFLTGRISDIEVTNRKQRPPVLITIQAIYTVGIVLSYYFATDLYFSITLWVYLSLFFSMLISFFWKISLHMVGNTLFFMLAGELLGLPVFVAVIALILIAWSRYALNKHTIMQLIAGTVLPIALDAVLR